MDSEMQKEIGDIKHQLGKQDVHSAERAKDIEYIKETLLRIELSISGLSSEVEKTNNRVGILELWKVQFVAKFAVYSSIALFLGTILSQLLLKWVSGKI
jgi:hypothetical protein